MGVLSIFGLIPLAFTVVLPVIAIVVGLIWLYQIKVNSDIQVKQNKEIINLLEKTEE